MIVEQLTTDHITDVLSIQPREDVELPGEDVLAALAEHPSWIAYDGDVIAAFGALPLDKDYYRCWAFLDKGASRRQLYQLFVWMDDFLETADFRRLDVNVQTDIPVAWLGRLGFELEGVMSKYDRHGNDHFLLARVQ